MNDTERQWLDEVAGAERGVPLRAGGMKAPSAKPHADQFTRRVLRVVVFESLLLFVFLLVRGGLDALADAVLPPAWASHWLTHLAGGLVAFLAFLGFALFGIRLLWREPYRELGRTEKLD